jgi:hypothetical protein
MPNRTEARPAKAALAMPPGDYRYCACSRLYTLTCQSTPLRPLFRLMIYSRSQPQQFPSQLFVMLGQVEVAHFVRPGLRPDDLDHLLSFCGRPIGNLWNQAQHQRPLFQRSPLGARPTINLHSQSTADFCSGILAHRRQASSELLRHPVAHSKSHIARGKRVPRAGGDGRFGLRRAIIFLYCSRIERIHFIEHVRFRQPLQHPPRRAILRVSRDFLFLSISGSPQRKPSLR